MFIPNLKLSKTLYQSRKNYPTSYCTAGNRAYVCLISNTVSITEIPSNNFGGAITPIASPYAIAITPNGNFAYVTNINDNTVSIIDTNTNTVVGSPIAVGLGPVAIAITPNGLSAYVANSQDNTVSVIDLQTNTVLIPPISVGQRPNGIVLTADGSFAYVSNFLSNDLSMIDTSTNTPLPYTIPLPSAPSALAITSSIPPPINLQGSQKKMISA